MTGKTYFEIIGYSIVAIKLMYFYTMLDRIISTIAFFIVIDSTLGLIADLQTGQPWNRKRLIPGYGIYLFTRCIRKYR